MSTLIFFLSGITHFLSGITHFTDMARYVSLTHEGLPFRELWVLISGIVELLGAPMVLFNWRPKLGALLIVLFLVPVTLVVHGYGMVSAEDARTFASQQSHFLKGVAMTGAALLLSQLGVARRP